MKAPTSCLERHGDAAPRQLATRRLPRLIWALWLVCSTLAHFGCHRSKQAKPAPEQAALHAQPASPQEIALAQQSARKLGNSPHLPRGISIARTLAPSGAVAMLAAAAEPTGAGSGWLATLTSGATPAQTSGAIPAQRWLATGGTAFAIGADIATDGEQAFFVWLHEDLNAGPSRQTVRVWQAAAARPDAGGPEPFTLLARPYGIRALAAAFDRKRKLLSLITDDTSRSANAGIVLWQTEWPPQPARLGPGNSVRLDPRPLFLAPWDRSVPTVFVAGDEVLITVNTGQRFGALAHEGKAVQGVWLLGDTAGQRLIGDPLPVRSIVGITPNRRIVYGPGNQAGDVPLRSLDYADAPVLP